MAFFLAQAAGTLASSFPWSINSVIESNAAEATVADSWSGAITALFETTSLRAYIPTTVEVTSASVSTATAAFKQSTKTTQSLAIAGTGTSVALPYHTCEVVTFRTALATRYGRGRWYLPPLGTNAMDTDGFSLLPAAQTALQAGMTAFFTSAASGFTMVILHRKATLNGGRAADTTDAVTACDIPSAFAVQRRRADKLAETRLSVSV
jgi:hypothetical protein